MKTKSLILHDIPRSIDLEIEKAVIDYSVAVCRVRGNDPETFTPLGSGTFVIRNGMYGILTAYHCLHAANPKVHIGAQGTDTLLLMVTRGRCLILDPEDVREHALAIPASDEFGPDLTFIQIFSGPKLDLLEAIVSFWNLDQKHHELANELSAPGIMIVEAGFPEIDYSTRIIGPDIHHDLRFVVFIGALGGENISTRDEWDYIHSKVDYRSADKIPETFKGVSGGGIWAVRLNQSKNQWTVKRRCLVGVVFYETDVSDNHRFLRGHFIKTIYDTAWDQRG